MHLQECAMTYEPLAMSGILDVLLQSVTQLFLPDRGCISMQRCLPHFSDANSPLDVFNEGRWLHLLQWLAIASYTRGVLCCNCTPQISQQQDIIERNASNKRCFKGERRWWYLFDFGITLGRLVKIKLNFLNGIIWFLRHKSVPLIILLTKVLW